MLISVYISVLPGASCSLCWNKALRITGSMLIKISQRILWLQAVFHSWMHVMKVYWNSTVPLRKCCFGDTWVIPPFLKKVEVLIASKNIQKFINVYSVQDTYLPGSLWIERNVSVKKTTTEILGRRMALPVTRGSLGRYFWEQRHTSSLLDEEEIWWKWAKWSRTEMKKGKEGRREGRTDWGRERGREREGEYTGVSQSSCLQVVKKKSNQIALVKCVLLTWIIENHKPFFWGPTPSHHTQALSFYLLTSLSSMNVISTPKM